jgi:hypothetical protein
MKLQLKKIVEVLSKIKDDDFYFKSYAPEIIESYVNQENIAFGVWLNINASQVSHDGWGVLNNEWLSVSEAYELFKRERSETV